MDENSRNSTKLDIERVRQQSAINEAFRAEGELKESYKQISEPDTNSNGLNGSSASNRPQEEQLKRSAIESLAEMPRENGTGAKEGEDERMLNGGSVDGGNARGGDGEPTEKDRLAQKETEVKFISSKNGDVRLDMELEKEQTFTGMTKEELMKYANDPFWVRLRIILFVLFWALWVAMLAGSVYIIYGAPKCAAPVPLTWWQEGPLMKLSPERYAEQLPEAERYGAKGVIFPLPADQTYYIDSVAVQEQLKQLISTYGAKDIKVVVDITPNHVTKDDPLFVEALQKRDSPAYRAFVWREAGAKPPNWLSVTEPAGTTAWKLASNGEHVLAQFGPDRYDLEFSETAARDKLKSTLRQLIALGVKGVRLENTKHLLVNRAGTDEEPLNQDEANKSLSLEDYGFWTHRETTYREGLGELLHELRSFVHEQTGGEGFLSVTEYLHRPEVFTANGTLQIDVPLYGNLEFDMRDGAGEPTLAKKLHHDIENAYRTVSEFQQGAGKAWLQLQYDEASVKHVAASEYSVFHFLLPGVPVFPVDLLTKGNVSQESIELLEKFRTTPSFQHGLFSVYNDANATAIAYTRLKSGNPGYFVALNLVRESDDQQVVNADFSGIDGIGSELTVVLTSQKYAVPNVGVKTKVPINAVPLSPMSALVATYVPTK